MVLWLFVLLIIVNSDNSAVNSLFSLFRETYSLNKLFHGKHDGNGFFQIKVSAHPEAQRELFHFTEITVVLILL